MQASDLLMALSELEKSAERCFRLVREYESSASTLENRLEALRKQIKLAEELLVSTNARCDAAIDATNQNLAAIKEETHQKHATSKELMLQAEALKAQAFSLLRDNETRKSNLDSFEAKLLADRHDLDERLKRAAEVLK